MARLSRVIPPGIPVHIIQRGNNRQVCFACEEDYGFYLAVLKEYALKYQVQVHAWVLMTNHVHLLCTALVPDGVSKMMQSLGRRYVQYFNTSYKRSGTLWEGRFKSCLVQDEYYLLQVYRYIESNPLRAGMVHDPDDYRWSSYRVNGVGWQSDLCTPHQEYTSLGKNHQERQQAYRFLFTKDIEDELLDEIRLSTHRGMALGSERFKAGLESLTGRRLTPKKRGRPVGWRKEAC